MSCRNHLSVSSLGTLSECRSRNTFASAHPCTWRCESSIIHLWGPRSFTQNSLKGLFHTFFRVNYCVLDPVREAPLFSRSVDTHPVTAGPYECPARTAQIGCVRRWALEACRSVARALASSTAATRSHPTGAPRLRVAGALFVHHAVTRALTTVCTARTCTVSSPCVGWGSCVRVGVVTMRSRVSRPV